MRIAIIAALFLVTSPANSQGDEAYLIIRAIVAQENERQPTMICMMQRDGCTHVRADESIVSIRPGRYLLDHIDFDEQEISAMATQVLKGQTRYRFESGNIYFLGEFILNKRFSNRYKVKQNLDIELMSIACDSAPDLFEKYLLASHDGKKKTKINCENFRKMPPNKKRNEMDGSDEPPIR